MTKEGVIAALLLLYPAAWRREYGDELTGILLSRPLGARVLADILWHGLVHRGRAAEPSTVLGVASMLVIVAGYVLTGRVYGNGATAVLRPSAMTFPSVSVTFLDSRAYAFLLIGCGCWTYLRHRGTAKRSGVAAMKMTLIAAMPIIGGALLMTAALVDLRGHHPPSAWAMLVAPLARLPGSWLWGALGGQFGKWIAARRRALTPAGSSE